MERPSELPILNVSSSSMENSSVNRPTVPSEDPLACINLLPIEILIKLFGYLDLVEQCRIRRVCTSWNAILKEDILHIRLNGSTLHHVWTNWSQYNDDDFPTGFQACMEQLGAHMAKLSVVEFDCGRIGIHRLVSGVCSFAEKQFASVAMKSVPAGTMLDLSFSDSAISYWTFLDLIGVDCTVRHLSLVRTELRLHHPGCNLFCTFPDINIKFLACHQIDIRDATSVSNKFHAVRGWLLERMDVNAFPVSSEQRMEMVKEVTSFAENNVPCWLDVLRIITRREQAYKDGMGELEDPNAIDFMVLKPMTVYEIVIFLLFES